MFSLDMRTAIFSYVLISAISTFVITFLLIQYNKRYRGVNYMFFCFALQTLALIMILLRGKIPDWITFDLANVISIGGIISFYVGIETYVGRKSSLIPNLVLLAVFTVVHILFTFVQPDMAARHLNVSVAWFILFIQCSWLLLFRVPASKMKLTLPVSLVSLSFCIVSLVRILKYFFYGHSADYFESDWLDTVIIIFSQLLLILLTYSLEHMFGMHLLEDIRAEEEKFSKAFNTSPYATLLSGYYNGRILEINKGFTRITGYAADEVKGKTTLELNIWLSGEDRNSMIKGLEESGKVHQKEMLFRKKSGELLTGLMSSEIITVNNEKCIFSSIDDITERKRNEAEKHELFNNLAESEEKYRTFFMNSMDAIFLTAPDGSIYSANPAACAMLGRPEKEICSLGRNGVVDETGSFTEAIKVREETGKFCGELTMIRKNGEKFPVELSSSVFIGRNGQKLTSIIARDITNRKNIEIELKRSGQLLEKLNQHIIDVRENERKQIGMALHDDLGQMLTGLYLDIAWLKNKIGIQPEQVMNKISDLGQMINETIENVKEISGFLRPAILFELGLIPAIDSQLRKFEEQSGIKCKFNFNNTAIDSGNHASLVLFRVLQESLTNIARHSSALRAEVTLRIINDRIEMIIHDDGIGIDNDKINSMSSLGIAGMIERVKGSGGKFQIFGLKGSGTTIMVTIPLNKEP